MTIQTVKTVPQAEQKFKRVGLEIKEINIELRLLRERMSSMLDLISGSIASATHPALSLDVNADVFLSLNATSQILGADLQGANKVFAGPVSGPDGYPNFRLLVDDDVPNTITIDNLTQIVTRNHFDLQSITPTDHHNPITLDTNADTILSLSTQELGLDTQTANLVWAGPGSGIPAVPTFRALVDDDVPNTITLDNLTQITTRNHSDLQNITPTDHHNPITLDVNADTVLSLSTQELGLDTQTANFVFAGPASGAPAVPTFRALVADDITLVLLTPGTLNTTTTNVATGNHTHAVTNTSDGAASANTLLSSDASGDLYLRRAIIDDWLRHDGDPDTYIEFADDTIRLFAGGAALVQALEDPVQDVLGLGDTAGVGDVDINFNSGQMLLIGSSGYLGIGTLPLDILTILESVAAGQTIFSHRNNAAANTSNEVVYQAKLLGGAGVEIALEVTTRLTTLTAGAEVSRSIFSTMDAGSQVNTLALVGNDVGVLTISPQDTLHVNGGIVAEMGINIGGDVATPSGQGIMYWDTQNSPVPGMIYQSQESAAWQLRYFMMFDTTNDGSFPFLTNRAPNGAVVIKTGSLAGGAENEHFRIEGGDGTVNAYFSNADVGIGTPTPVTALEVVGSITVSDDIIHAADTDTKIAFTPDQQIFSAGGVALLELTESTQDIVLVGDGVADVDFTVQAPGMASALFVEGSSGWVSINKFGPATELDVAGSITVADDIIHSGDTDTKIAFTPDQQAFSVGGVTMLELTESTQDIVLIGDGIADVDFTVQAPGVVQALFMEGSSGRVSINKGSPASELDVSGSITVSDSIIHAGDTDTNIAFTPDNISFSAGGLAMLTLDEDTQDTITLGPGSGDVDINFNGDMFMWGANGRLGIGSVSPSGKLHVAHSSDPDIYFDNTGSTAGERSASLNFDHSNGTGARIRASRESGDADGMSLRFFTEPVGGALTERMRITEDGKFGFNTTTVPHAAIGVGMIAIDGADNSDDGPHIQTTTVADNYPLLQINSYQHDNIGFAFDAYYDGTIWRSSDIGSNFTLTKQSDLLRIFYSSGNSQGATFSWNTGFALDTNGMIGLNTTVNANMTIGLTIDQLTNDDQALALQSSVDVVHGMTSIAEAETFGAFSKAEGGSGGLKIEGLKDADGTAGRALQLHGLLGEQPGTGKSTSTNAVVEISAQIESGTSVTDVVTDGNMVAMKNNTTTRWILDADGDVYIDGTQNTYDTLNDVELIRALDIERVDGVGIVQSRFDEWLQYNRDDLERLKLASFNEDSTFICMTGLVKLHSGAIWQQHLTMMGMQERINELEEKINGLI